MASVMNTTPPRPTRGLAAIYGGIHCLVDATTVTVTFAAIGLHDLDPGEAFGLVLLYDSLAFGTQWFLGLAADRASRPKAALLAGLVLCFASVLLLGVEPWSAAVVAGLGNSLFHVGAGAISLCTRPGSATDPGLFVAPGALGLALGVWIGRSGGAAAWPFLALLSVAFVLALRLRDPAPPASPRPGVGREPDRATPAPLPLAGAAAHAIVLLLALSVVVRAFVGMGGCHACPKEPLIALGVPLAAFAGKLLGGVVSDRLGWIETSLPALLLSAPLIAFSGGQPTVVLPGLLLFQMTMPVTLVAIQQVQPARPGFSFGIACLALLAGSIPTFFAPVRAVFGAPLFLGLILGSAAALVLGLRMLGDRVPPGRLSPVLRRHRREVR